MNRISKTIGGAGFCLLIVSFMFSTWLPFGWPPPPESDSVESIPQLNAKLHLLELRSEACRPLYTFIWFLGLGLIGIGIIGFLIGKRRHKPASI